ncbi:uncharacterized protein LOC129540606 [Moschus berezovskii]|uniref:uncharacterized protein LOC129540606 n=1 Tax=Moschus berezovskii TaxID=68408 RepID=UPI002443AA56|nr:uncharacterized protein LOC129540606 [Moschus berezovskii]
MASGESPFPHFLEPREPVSLEPQVLPRRLGGRPPPQPPAGDSFPLGDLPWRVSPEPLELIRLPGEEDGFLDLPLGKLPSRRVSVSSPSSRPSAQSLSPPPRDSGRPGANFSANFAAGADARLGLLISQICKTLRSGESTEGLSARVSFPEPAWCGCCGCENCTGLGTPSRASLVTQTVKNMPATQRPDSIPESGRSPGERKSCLQNFMERGA